MSTDLTLNHEQIDLVRRTIAKGASDDELKLFLNVCNRTRLDPFSRQIYAIKRWDSKEKREVLQAQISIDGARIVADRSQKYQGQLGPWWCGDDGQWKEIWLESKPPTAARVGVLRDGFREPLFRTAKYSSYVQTTKDGQPNTFWRRMPDLMLAKCAEMNALRAAFPHDLSGLYIAEEMGPEDSVDLPKQIPQTQPELAESKFATPTTPVRPPAPAAPAEPRTTINKNEAAVINGLLVENGVPWEWLLKQLEVSRAGEITIAQLDNIMANIGHMKKQYDEDQEEEIVINDANEEAVGV